MIKKIIFLFFCFAVSFANGQNVEMADTFRAEGKIYVVVAVVLLVLVGLFIYLFRIDRKIKNLENE